ETTRNGNVGHALMLRTQTRSDSDFIRKRSARHWIKTGTVIDGCCVRRPGEAERFRCWRRAGILHQICVLRMREGPLRLSHVSETEFIHRAVADCPRMAEV